VQGCGEGVQGQCLKAEAAGEVGCRCVTSIALTLDTRRLVFYDASGKSGVPAQAFDHGRFIVHLVRGMAGGGDLP